MRAPSGAVHERAEIGVAAEGRPDGAPTAPRLLYPPSRGRAGRSGAPAVERILGVGRRAPRSHTPKGWRADGRAKRASPLPTAVARHRRCGPDRPRFRWYPCVDTCPARVPVRLGCTRAALERSPAPWLSMPVGGSPRARVLRGERARFPPRRGPTGPATSTRRQSARAPPPPGISTGHPRATRPNLPRLPGAGV